MPSGDSPRVAHEGKQSPMWLRAPGLGAAVQAYYVQVPM